VVYVITIQNSGPSAGTGIVVTDSLPANVILMDSTPSQGAFDAATGVWTVGTLAAAGEATLTLTARVNAIGTGVNTAEITSATPIDPDSTPGNNDATEDDQVSVSFTT